MLACRRGMNTTFRSRDGLDSLCIVVADIKQHTKFQERPSSRHGCENAGRKQCPITGVPALARNSKSKFLRFSINLVSLAR